MAVSPAGVALGLGRHLQAGSRWVRKEYRIDGDYISPVLGSPTEVYDPFDCYFGPEAAVQRKSLYLHLAGLDVEDPASIEEFASRWGLLGVFTHNMARIHFRPKSPHPENHGFELEFDLSCVLGFEQAALSHIVDDDYWDASVLFLDTPEGWECGEIPLHTREAGHLELPLALYCRDYFPGLFRDAVAANTEADIPGRAERRLAQVIGSPAIWDHLCEPLGRFRGAVTRFQEAFAASGSWSSDPDVIEDYASLLAGRLADHLAQVRPKPRYVPPTDGSTDGRGHGKAASAGKTGHFTMAWSYPSLLSAAYLMLVLDLTENRKLRFCENERCRKPFVADLASKLHCSEECQTAQKMRRHRRKKASEREGT